MPTVMPEGANVRKAVQWISNIRQEVNKPLPILIEQACMRFNLSPKDADFLNRFFRESQEEK